MEWRHLALQILNRRTQDEAFWPSHHAGWANNVPVSNAEQETREDKRDQSWTAERKGQKKGRKDKKEKGTRRQDKKTADSNFCYRCSAVKHPENTAQRLNKTV